MATFQRSKLTRERDPELAQLYARLFEVRRELPRGDADTIAFDENVAVAAGSPRRYEVVCNFAARGTRLPCEGVRVLIAHTMPRN